MNRSGSEFPKLGVAVTVFRERNPDLNTCPTENKKHSVNVTPGMASLQRVTDHEVLLVQRGQEPMKGLWSLPGGKVEFGEEIETAAKREIKEECSVDIALGRPFYATNAIIKDKDDAVTYHYGLVHVLASVPYHQTDDLCACDDVAQVRWVPVSQMALPEHHDISSASSGVKQGSVSGSAPKFEPLECVPGVSEVVSAALKIVNGADCEYWLPSYAEDMMRNVASTKYEGYTS